MNIGTISAILGAAFGGLSSEFEFFRSIVASSGSTSYPLKPYNNGGHTRRRRAALKQRNINRNRRAHKRA